MLCNMTCQRHVQNMLCLSIRQRYGLCYALTHVAHVLDGIEPYLRLSKTILVNNQLFFMIQHVNVNKRVYVLSLQINMRRYATVGISVPIQFLKQIDQERGLINRSRFLWEKIKDVYQNEKGTNIKK